MHSHLRTLARATRLGRVLGISNLGRKYDGQNLRAANIAALKLEHHRPAAEKGPKQSGLMCNISGIAGIGYVSIRSWTTISHKWGRSLHSHLVRKPTRNVKGYRPGVRCRYHWFCCRWSRCRFLSKQVKHSCNENKSH